jgi:hypothetical protein
MGAARGSAVNAAAEVRNHVRIKGVIGTASIMEKSIERASRALFADERAEPK